MPPEDCCETKLDKELPATSPSVYSAPYSANVILDRPLVPERFGATPAMLNGLADATTVIQRMLDASQASEKDKLKPVELGAGSFVMDGQATIDLGNYNGSMLKIRGAGNNGTRLILDRANSTGAIKINRPYNMEYVEVSDLLLVSQLAQNAGVPTGHPYNAAANNGVGLWITSTLAPGHPGYGVQQDKSVRLSRIHVHGIGDQSGIAHSTGVWGEAAIKLENIWHAVIEDLALRGIYDPSWASASSGNNQNALLLRNCYAPEVVNPQIDGWWQTAIRMMGLEAGNFDNRWEGGRLVRGLIAGSRDGLVIDHDIAPGFEAPGFHLLGNHLNCSRFAVHARNHRHIISSNNQFYAYNLTRPAGEVLPASFLLENCSDIDSCNDQFLEPGHFTSDNEARCHFRVKGQVHGLKVVAPRFNSGGIGVRVDDAQADRSIQVIAPDRSGRKITGGTPHDWAAFKEVTGSGSSAVVWDEVTQGSWDQQALDSRTADVHPSPRQLIRRLRSDYASNPSGNLGQLAIQGWNSARDVVSTLITDGDFESNVAGAENSRARMFGMRSGSLVSFLTWSGSTNQAQIDANRLGLATSTTNGNAVPAFDLTRYRSDFASTGSTPVKLGQIRFRGWDSAQAEKNVALMESGFVKNTVGADTGYLQFATQNAGGISLPMRIEGDHVYVGKLWANSFVAGTPVTPNGNLQYYDAVGNLIQIPAYGPA